MPGSPSAAMSDVLIDRDRAKKLLGAGLSNDIVSSTLGCDHSYISQLMAEDDFRQQVTELRILSLTAATARDEKIDALEDTILNKLENSLDFILKPRELLETFRTLNGAKRRGVPAHESTVINNNVVNLTMPVMVLQQFQRNGMNEVVQIGERPLVTINSAELLRVVAGEHPEEKKREELLKLAQQLPSSIREALAVSDSLEDGRRPSNEDYAKLGFAREG